MNKPWKLLLPLMLCGGLVACTTTSQVPVEPETQPKVETPKTEVTTPEVVQPETQPKEEVKTEKVEPEVKPQEVKPKPKPLPKKTSDGKLILGEQEWVYVPGLTEFFKARIDTGATTSSISAIDVIPFERDGKEWVKFKIEHDKLKSKELALPVERWVKIKQSSSDESQKRAVVAAWIQIGDLKQKTEFTLADRTHLAFPLLLGRSFFNDVAVVDVSRKFVQPKQTK
ncbi:ATP-dependent zinc protease family protein [Vibrio proteolyticus]